MSKKKKIFDSVETLIGTQTTLKGTIISSKTVRVDGQVIGNIEKCAGVIVGEAAFVKGNIEANYVVVAGKVEGNIIATEGIELLNQSSVVGNIQTNILSISEGAYFEGKSVMIKDEPKETEEEEPEEEQQQMDLND